MGINPSKKTIVGPDYLGALDQHNINSDQEKYILQHIFTHLQLRSGYSNKISLISLHEYFDIPVLHLLTLDCLAN